MTIEKSSNKKICQNCALQGIRSTVHLFQINDKESLLMCKNADCTFMPSDDLEHFVVKRDLSKLTVKPKFSSSSSSSSLSSFGCSSAPPSVYNSFRGPKSLSSDSENCLQPTHQTGSLVSPKIFLRPTTPSEICDRKSLVPFAPFLSGHAHNFYSFQTSKIEGFKKRHSADADEGLAKKAKIDSFSFTEDKIKTSESFTSVDSQKFISCDPGSPKSNNTKLILIPNGSLAKIDNGVLKIRFIQDKRIDTTKSNDETKFVVKPVGLLEDFRKDCSTESALFNSHTSESGISKKAAISEQLIVNNSKNKVISELEKTDISTLVSGANQTKQYTTKKNKGKVVAKNNKEKPDSNKNKGKADVIKNKEKAESTIDLPIPTDNQLVCNIESFDFNHEVTELDDYYINF
ncbi:hypothetical protein Btru_009762 [Bulinus truncatus]|nr:hypothetical protein Btru_009762 [Bulinus truncatus]